jgi:hypothetical protein
MLRTPSSNTFTREKAVSREFVTEPADSFYAQQVSAFPSHRAAVLLAADKERRQTPALVPI